jgi:hypothetical protein
MIMAEALSLRVDAGYPASTSTNMNGNMATDASSLLTTHYILTVYAVYVSILYLRHINTCPCGGVWHPDIPNPDWLAPENCF